MIRITRDSIDTLSLRSALLQPDDGAVVLFEGVVRNHSRGRTVRRLEYEAYEPMAAAKLEDIERRARQSFAVRDIGIVHRLGSMDPTECSVAIAVTAAHRAEAFHACRFIIDEIKKTVPIWKKEIYEDGEVWIEGSD
jgi:molybdopterin synthase catalytic subunit